MTWKEEYIQSEHNHTYFGPQVTMGNNYWLFSRNADQQGAQLRYKEPSKRQQGGGAVGKLKTWSRSQLDRHMITTHPYLYGANKT